LLFLTQADILAELDELEKEALEEQLLDVSSLSDHLPSVPVEEPTKVATKASKGLLKIVDKLTRIQFLTYWCKDFTAHQPLM